MHLKSNIEADKPTIACAMKGASLMDTGNVIDYRILGKRMKDARERLGKTQCEIADELNIIVSTYGKFERGTLKPNLERLIAICTILNISVQDSLRGAVKVEISTNNPSPTHDDELLLFQNLLDQCRKPETIRTMLTICAEIAMLENVR
jgi:transcriptional regulator with XRE-family HTH domain